MYNGVIYNDSSTAIAQVTDGTSSTMLFAEHSHFMETLNDPNYYVSDNSWQSGRWYDTLFCTLYPMGLNLQAIPAQVNGPFGYYSSTAANSLHPGGANFAFCDGSVRFLKSTINTWTVSGGTAPTPPATPSPTERLPPPIRPPVNFFSSLAMRGSVFTRHSPPRGERGHQLRPVLT